MVRVKEVNSLEKVYENILRSINTGKNFKAGGVLVTFPDKERNLCELSTTYLVKLGRFSKEQRVVVTLAFKRDSGEAYVANVEDSVFQLVQEEKGGLKEVWSGGLKEAMDRFGDIARLHIDAVSKLSSNFS